MTTEAITPLRPCMIEDMNARKLCAGTQRGHIHSCRNDSGIVRPTASAVVRLIRDRTRSARSYFASMMAV
jgi:hypothetical protein